MKTKNLLKLAMVSAAVLFAGLAGASAVTTNVVQNINLQLTFYEQGPTNQTGNRVVTKVNQVRVTTKDLIAALGTATSNNFSSSAQLVYLRDATSNILTGVVVRDGTNIVDVSDYFAETNGALLIHGSTENLMTGISTGVSYGTMHLVVTNNAPGILHLPIVTPADNLNLTFNVRGFVTITHVALTVNKRTF